MPDPSIHEFLATRKAARLKSKVTASMSEEEIQAQQQACDEEFALPNWLPDAARRAGQINMATHPCTFSHPSARRNKNGNTTSVLASAIYEADGLLRTGNIEAEADALGNAAALDVYGFLSLVMQDGRKLIDHLQADTELAQELLAKSKGDVVEIKDGFLAMVSAGEEAITSSKIKQVYFPVPDAEQGYHLLSTLTNSGHVFELRKRLDSMRFSDETKALRELRRSNQFSEQGYQEIYNLTTIGYGGTKPQNISVKNNQNGGKAHLLLSTPPNLTPRNVRLPAKDFFKDVLYARQLQETYTAFHKLLSADYNNIRIRQARDYRIQEYLDHVILKMWQVRNAFTEQPHSRPERLIAYQKQWLFPEHQAERSLDVPWLDTLISDITRNFIASYERVMGNSAIKLADVELTAFSKIIEQNKEALL